jgi:hypothetical protein
MIKIASFVVAGLLLAGASAQAQTWTVAHDHGDDFGSYCVGRLTVGRRIVFDPDHGRHGFASDYDRIKEAKANAFVGVEKGGFHIKFYNDDNYNFAILQQGRWGRPGRLLDAIAQAIADGYGAGRPGAHARSHATPGEPGEDDGVPEIARGMSMQDVEDVMGEPDEKLKYGSRVKWVYSDMTVIFERGRVVDVKF